MSLFLIVTFSLHNKKIINFYKQKYIRILTQTERFLFIKYLVIYQKSKINEKKNIISGAGYSRQTLKRRASEMMEKNTTQKDDLSVPIRK